MKRDYFIEAAREIGKTLGEYYADASENFVLFDKNEKLVCFNDGMPMVFGSLGDAIAEVENWPIEERALFTVSSEQKLIDKIVEGVYYEH